MGHRISIQAAPLWVSSLKGKMRSAAIRGLQSAGRRAVEEIQTRLIPAENPEPVDTGAYRAGWQAKDEPEGSLIENTLPRASIIELGARAANIKIGKAMIEALQAWVMRKGIVGKLARRGTRKRFAQENEARSTAWAIAVAMQKRGIFNRVDRRGGLRILEKATKIIPRLIVEEVRRELEKMRDSL